MRKGHYAAYGNDISSLTFYFLRKEPIAWKVNCFKTPMFVRSSSVLSCQKCFNILHVFSRHLLAVALVAWLNLNFPCCCLNQQMGEIFWMRIAWNADHNELKSSRVESSWVLTNWNCCFYSALIIGYCNLIVPSM